MYFELLVRPFSLLSSRGQDFGTTMYILILFLSCCWSSKRFEIYLGKYVSVCVDFFSSSLRYLEISLFGGYLLSFSGLVYVITLYVILLHTKYDIRYEVLTA